MKGKIELALLFFGVFLAWTGFVWLACRASVELGWPAIRGLIKDPPFALIIAGGVLGIAIGLYHFMTWLLTRIP